MNPESSPSAVFSRKQIFVIAILSILQFTVVLDFMVLSPLGAMLIPTLAITPAQFSLVVSAYAFSAGASGLLAAGFADRFDRKKMLLFFYTGFIIGTAMCGLAPGYSALLVARVVTGLFGGVISSISFAIITDLFKLEVRGRVMGFVQTSFAASQVLGIPIGLFLSNHFGWHAPFLMIVGFSVIVYLFIHVYLPPITGHLSIRSEHGALAHFGKTVARPDYLRGFLATTLLATGGFMLMPFASAFCINNIGLTNEQLPFLYGVTGVFSMVLGPLIGKTSDRIGKFRTFVLGSLLSSVMIVIYTHFGVTPLWIVICTNIAMFTGISSRMISSSALMSAVPEPQDRGAFMGINSSVQQISGGLAAVAAGMVVVQNQAGQLLHYDWLGYIVIASMALTVTMMYFINQQVMRKAGK